MSQTINAAEQAAYEYIELGWKLVPLYGINDRGRCECGKDCSGSAGKHPRVNGWPKVATDDEEIISGWFDRWPGMNLGVRLGQPSGIVDVEFDDEEGRETASKYLEGAFTPTFESGRSIHRLFRWTPELPLEDKVLWRGLELRIGSGVKGFQTVLPPSRHHSGVPYRWLPGLSPGDVEPDDFPSILIAELAADSVESRSVGSGFAAKSDEFYEKIFRGVGEGERNQSLTSLIGALLRDLGNVNDPKAVQRVFTTVELVNEQNNPPLARTEVEKTFRSILNKEVGRRAGSEMAEFINTDPLAFADGDTGEWKIVIVDSEPREFRLYAPQFGKTDGGYITLTASQLNSPAQIKTQATEQAKCCLPSKFHTMWLGPKTPKKDEEEGLFSKLMRTATEVPAGWDQKDSAVIASLAASYLDMAGILAPNDKPTQKRPSKSENGEHYFGFTQMAQHVATRCPERIPNLRIKLSKILQSCGRHETTSMGERVFVMTSEQVLTLRHFGVSNP